MAEDNVSISFRQKISGCSAVSCTVGYHLDDVFSQRFSVSFDFGANELHIFSFSGVSLPSINIAPCGVTDRSDS